MKRTALMLVAALALAAPAAAGWQSTRWGMTPAQVVAASEGQSRLGTGRPGQRITGDPRTLQVIGTHRSGNHAFETAFYFHGGTRLALIKMELEDATGGCGPLIGDLKKVYGAPDEHTAEPVIQFTRWHDEARNNLVTALQIGDDYCSLEYEPLEDANTSGL